MLLNDEQKKVILFFLSSFTEDKDFESVDDLFHLNSLDLLKLLDQLQDDFLYLVINILKENNYDQSLFDKLKGGDCEESKHLSESFFQRYYNLLLENKSEHFNPLLEYLPKETFRDLVFIQSRQPFFQSQEIRVINEFLEHHFKNDDKLPTFQVEEQDMAWGYFWNKILECI